jgi:hypothetical protein
VLPRAATDTTLQQVMYEDRLRTVAGVPARPLTVTGGLALATATVTVTVVHRSRRRPVTPPPPGQPPTPMPARPPEPIG